MDLAINSEGLRTITTYGPINRSITSLSGSSQLLMAANPLRKGFTIQNTGTLKVTVSWLTITAVENATGVFEMDPGSVLTVERIFPNGLTPVSAIYVLGTAGQPLFAQEWLAYGGIGA